MANRKSDKDSSSGKPNELFTDFDPPKPLKRNKYAFACAMLASMTSILLGYDTGVMSGAQKYIQRDLHCSDTEIEILVGTINLYALVGAAVAGRTSDWIGRRYTIVLAGAIFFIGAILMGFATNYMFLMVGRFVAGIGVGYALMIAPVYTAEVSPTSARGFLTSFPEVFINADMSLLDALKVQSFNELEFTEEEMGEAGTFSEHVSKAHYSIRDAATPGVESSNAAVDATTSQAPHAEPNVVETSQAEESREKCLSFEVNDETEEVVQEEVLESLKGKSRMKRLVSSSTVGGVSKKLKFTSGTYSEGAEVSKAMDPDTRHLDNLNKHLTGGKSSRDSGPIFIVDSPPGDLEGGGFKGNPSVGLASPPVMESAGKTTGDVAQSKLLKLFPSLPSDVVHEKTGSFTPLWSEIESLTLFYLSENAEGITLLSSEDKFVPNWDLKNGDRIIDALTAKMMLFNLDTPADRSHYSSLGSSSLSDAFLVNQVQSNFLSGEVYRRWVEAETERDRLRKRIEDFNQAPVLEGLKTQLHSTQATLAAVNEEKDKLGKEVEGLKAKLVTKEVAQNAAAKKYAESMKNMESELETLRSQVKGIEGMENRIKEVELELAQKTEKYNDEVLSLRVEKDDLMHKYDSLMDFKKFMLSEGVPLMIQYIHKCSEMQGAVAKVNNAMNNVGFNVGLKAGYAYSAKNIPYEKCPRLVPNAQEDLVAAVNAYDTLEFPQLSRFVDMITEPSEDIIQAFRKLKITEAEAPKTT